MKAEEDSAAQAANEKESDSTASDDDEDLDDEDSEDFSSSPSSEVSVYTIQIVYNCCDYNIKLITFLCLSGPR